MEWIAQAGDGGRTVESKLSLYDFLGYVATGTVVVLAIVWQFQPATAWLKDNPILGASVALVLAYVVGQLVQAIGKMLQKALLRTTAWGGWWSGRLLGGRPGAIGENGWRDWSWWWWAEALWRRLSPEAAKEVKRDRAYPAEVQAKLEKRFGELLGLHDGMQWGLVKAQKDAATHPRWQNDALFRMAYDYIVDNHACDKPDVYLSVYAFCRGMMAACLVNELLFLGIFCWRLWPAVAGVFVGRSAMLFAGAFLGRHALLIHAMRHTRHVLRAVAPSAPDLLTPLGLAIAFEAARQIFTRRTWEWSRAFADAVYLSFLVVGDPKPSAPANVPPSAGT